jgi:glucosyl-3-phosphoglycerate phosphatase
MSSGRRLLLVRHGESEGNFERCFSPNPHIELTERGVDQARTAGRLIASGFAPVRIVSSPFRRAVRTARLIAGETSYDAEIDVEHDLRERDIGELAGRPYGWMREHPAYRPDRFWEWRPAGGESLVDVQERAAPVLQRILANGPEGDVVVVSHGGVMLALCAHIEGSWLRPHVARNCEVLVVESTPSGLTVAAYAGACEPDESGEKRDAEVETG